jgi:Flp pilus assembly protein TadD
VRPTNPAMAATLYLCRGNALDRLARLDEADSAWLEALEADPTAPEAGWNLLRLYYLQGREVEARNLALRL